MSSDIRQVDMLAEYWLGALNLIQHVAAINQMYSISANSALDTLGDVIAMCNNKQVKFQFILKPGKTGSNFGIRMDTDSGDYIHIDKTQISELITEAYQWIANYKVP